LLVSTSQTPNTVHLPEPVEITPHTQHFFNIHFNIVFPSMLRSLKLSLPFFYIFQALIYHFCATCLALVVLNLIILIIVFSIEIDLTVFYLSFALSYYSGSGLA